MESVPLNRPYLPPFAKYQRLLGQVFDRGWLTNDGPLVRELTVRLEEYLGVENLLLVANGTLGLQVAYRAVGLSGSVLTTPYSFVATASSLMWEGLTPEYVDIDPATLNLDPRRIPAAVPGVSGIVPVHVYGRPCDGDAIDAMAARRDLKIVYDAAHAFGVRVGGRSILTWGDASVLSFHATKTFHTGEGGAIVFRDRAAYDRARLMINFGLPEVAGRVSTLGINAKMSEMHAAMGLCVLDDIVDVLARRNASVDLYRSLLPHRVLLDPNPAAVTPNGAYMPIRLESAEERDRLTAGLAERGIGSRKYFARPLDVAYGDGTSASPVAGEASTRILCLPLFADLSEESVRRVSRAVTEILDTPQN